MLGGVGALLLFTLVAGPARGQAPLIVGSVRDQHGAAIAGATVTAERPAAGAISTTTDGSGTFALHASGVEAVTIDCRYCLPARVAVVADQPVVAIVRRYDALADGSPSPEDLANLPYAHVESSIGLRPFTLLAQTTAAYPGSALSDRGISGASLLVDDGVPNYDIVAGESPYTLIPAQFEQSAVLHDASNAYAYGDQAAGGIVQADPFVPGSNFEVATLGSDVIARVQAGSDQSAVALATFSNDDESRQRVDAFAVAQLGADQSLAFSGGSEQGRDYQDPDAAFSGSFSFGDAVFTVPRSLNLTISTVFDRGNYEMSEDEYPISTGWSDSGFSAGIHTSGPIVAFADVGTRSSSGYYDAQALPAVLPRVGASLTQERADAGIRATGRAYDVTAAVGAFWFNYAGGWAGLSWPAHTALAVPSLDAKLFPNGRWSLNLQGSGGFTLPTFIQQYLYSGPPTLPVELQRDEMQAAIVTYSDLARLRVSFEQASENVAGVSSGRMTSTGFSATWQLAPTISLRAWTMHVSDTVPLYGGAIPDGLAPTVNAVWMTYDTGDALRADAIYRRDLLNGLPFYHFDGAISGPISGRLRWYAGAEDRMHRTFVDAGLRFDGR